MASAVRIITFERDEATDTRAVLDIREFDAPAAMETPTSFTALAKDRDAARRAILLDLSRQIDQLVDGEIAELHIFATTDR